MLRCNRGRAALAAAGGLAVAALAAPAAGAAGVAGGTTALTLDAGTAKALAAAKVEVTGRGGARVRGREATLRVTGGRLDYADGSGRLTHRGALRLAAGRRKVTLAKLEVSRSALTARVGGRRLAVATVKRSRWAAASGFVGGTLSRGSLAFTAKAARALNRALGADLLERGAKLGTLRVRVEREFAVRSGTTTLVPDPATLQVLTAAGITLAPVAPATLGASGLAFPVSGGALDLAARTGTIAHTGGLSLAKGATVISLTEPEVVLARAATFSVVAGSLGRQVIADVDLSGAQLAPRTTARGGTLAISGAVVRLNALAATALNSQLGLAVQPGTPLGTVGAQLSLR
jgi:hypothetical protein